MGREVSLFIIITAGKHAGSVLFYHHLPVPQSKIRQTRIRLLTHFRRVQNLLIGKMINNRKNIIKAAKLSY